MEDDRIGFQDLEMNGIDIEFENINYSVRTGRKGRKQVICGVSGKFKSGELTAIMGPSGAGKTTLLNILTGFETDRGVQGTIRSTGAEPGKVGAQQYKKQSCYILQDDHLPPWFTVREYMGMAAELKLGTSVSEKAKLFLIDDILDTLSLKTTKETRCGRLSGGQKKRMSIALELIDNPPIMFLDEPTTGLDSCSSSQCISTLKRLARGGRTIICTIHQPSASIYENFDHVYVMAEGKCIYQGASLNTVAYLSSVGLNCPQYHNPADYLLEVANGEYGNFTDMLSKPAEEEHWRIAVTSPKQSSNGEHKKIAYKEGNRGMVMVTPPSEWYKFKVLLRRSLLQIYRDWTISHLKFILHLMVGVFLGCFYYKIGNDGSKAVTNVGYFMASSAYLLYTSIMPCVLRFPGEIAVLRKERFNNWYNLKTYYLAFLVSDIPMQLLFSLAYTSTSYFISDQPYEIKRFLMVTLMLIQISLVASSLGLVIGTTVCPINGTFFGAIISALMLVLGGFLIFFTHMNRFFYALSYLSFLAYAFEGMMQATYGYGRTPLPCPEEVEYCHVKMPDMILRELGVTAPNYWWDVTFLSMNIIAFRALAFWTLKRRLRTG